MTERDDDLTFASLGRRQRGVRSACPICGQSTAGGVQLSLMSRKAGKPKLLTSQSKTLCERHTVELYKRLTEAFDTYLAGGRP